MAPSSPSDLSTRIERWAAYDRAPWTSTSPRAPAPSPIPRAPRCSMRSWTARRAPPARWRARPASPRRRRATTSGACSTPAWSSSRPTGAGAPSASPGPRSPTRSRRWRSCRRRARARTLRRATRAEAERAARTCYDHLAGALGVAVCDALLAAGAIAPDGERAYALGPGAGDAFAAIGVTPPAGDTPRLRAPVPGLERAPPASRRSAGRERGGDAARSPLGHAGARHPRAAGHRRGPRGLARRPRSGGLRGARRPAAAASWKPVGRSAAASVAAISRISATHRQPFSSAARARLRRALGQRRDRVLPLAHERVLDAVRARRLAHGQQQRRAALRPAGVGHLQRRGGRRLAVEDERLAAPLPANSSATAGASAPGEVQARGALAPSGGAPMMPPST